MHGLTGKSINHTEEDKMPEQNIEDLNLEYTEVWSRDKDGNLVKVKLY
jgi:hypothetical protein